jgi:hypothetical protein
MRANPVLSKITKEMLKEAETTFSESELDALRCIIRITFETFGWIMGYNVAKLPQLDAKHQLEYWLETIISGIDSFLIVYDAYKVLVGYEPSSVIWNTLSVTRFDRIFESRFKEFVHETIFEKKCRHLLDLYKMQIVLVGWKYA